MFRIRTPLNSDTQADEHYRNLLQRVKDIFDPFFDLNGRMIPMGHRSFFKCGEDCGCLSPGESTHNTLVGVNDLTLYEWGDLIAYIGLTTNNYCKPCPGWAARGASKDYNLRRNARVANEAMQTFMQLIL